MPSAAPTAIYAIASGNHDDHCIRLAVERIAVEWPRIILVCEDKDLETVTAWTADLPGCDIRAFESPERTPLAAAKQILLAERDTLTGPVLLTGAHVLGPTGPIGPDALLQGADVFAPYWQNAALDPRMQKISCPQHVPYFDFTVFAAHVLQQEAFWSFWQTVRPRENTWEDFTRTNIDFARLLEKLDLSVRYPTEPHRLGTSDPRLFEVHKGVKMGFPVVAVDVLKLDPLLHDLNAIDVRTALDELRLRDPDLYRCVIRYATRFLQAREFNTIADQYEVISDTSETPDRQDWSFGPIAVFIHAFYADMMPEFWELIERLPRSAHLFLTTATEENAARIRAFISEKDWPKEQSEVRVVAQNRGRDMSSLFITWRDIIMDNRFEVALRLHSKRTPQVSRQVGDSFRDHLFDNLVYTPGYVRNVLDIMEREPDIGLIIPPVIHVGFGTLGHSWFANKSALNRLMRNMGMDVPLDHDTPVAAYGTMYWFRTDALRTMFEWTWDWKQYNAEPHHIDGGLAHVQERLIGYCVQHRGYRTLQVMNARLAARNYARLEYKLQLFASFLGSNNVLDQRIELESTRSPLKQNLYKRLRLSYGEMLRRFPASRRYLRPFKNAAVSFLSRRG